MDTQQERRETPSSDRVPGYEGEEERLGPTERLGLRLGHAFAYRLRRLSQLWTWYVMFWPIWLCISRRLRHEGFERLDALPRDASVIIVANHRTFFDFYILSACLCRLTRMAPRVNFPVRSTFFYDRPLGVALNLIAAGMTMYPPFFRDKPQLRLNRSSLAICVELLQRPGAVLGIHPEGTRNKNADPYELLPGQFGVGQIIARAPARTRVYPMFALGLTDNVLVELWKNWFAPRAWPIDLLIGEPLDFSDVRGDKGAPSVRAVRDVVARCMDAVRELGLRVRALRAQRPK